MVRNCRTENRGCGRQASWGTGRVTALPSDCRAYERRCKLSPFPQPSFSNLPIRAVSNMPAPVITLAMIREHLGSALLSDALDSVGHLRQVPSFTLRPITGFRKLVGRARTSLW